MKQINRMALSLTLPLVVIGVFVFFVRHRDEGQRQRRVAGAGRSVTVKRGDDLQAAVKSAAYGDILILEAGATFMGPLVLPDKGAGSGTDADYITIRTSDLEAISKEGERIKPAQHAAHMPKIVSPSQQAAVTTAPQANHYKFVGIEFAPAPDSQYLYNLIDLGSSDYSTTSQFPHHLIFDRCYVHATGLNKARRGFALNDGETSILNSYVSGFAGEGDETQAIAGWNGPGPFHIVNNYLEAGGEVILFGGGDPKIHDLVPSDIEIRRNYLYKPAEWAGHVTIKGMFELKNAKRVIVDANLMTSPIRITAMVITVRNQGGSAPWSTIEDLQITNNIVRHASTGINLLGKDDPPPTQEAKRIRIANNLFLDVVSPNPGDTAYFLQINGGDQVTVEHNTVQQQGNLINAYGKPATNFVFRNNIIQFSLYGVVCFTPGAQCPRENLFCHCFPNGAFRGNIFADNLGAARNGGAQGGYPSGNFFSASFDTIGFVNYRQDDWHLAPNSSYRRKATDGKDPGVDFEALNASGVNHAAQGTR